jgi:hypothetical protein
LKPVPAGFKIRTKFLKIVDFAVVNDPDRSVFVEKWLMSASEINNAQPAHAQSRAILDEHTLFVRAAMNNRIAHTADCCFVDATIFSVADDSRYSAHS